LQHGPLTEKAKVTSCGFLTGVLVAAPICLIA
jgi:hypothetical protein